MADARNVHTDIPSVEKIAVSTVTPARAGGVHKPQYHVSFGMPISDGEGGQAEEGGNARCPGMALKRMTMGILNPPWRTTSTSSAYLSFVSSIFCARALHMYLNALQVVSVAVT